MVLFIIELLSPVIVLGAVSGLHWQSWIIGLTVAAAVAGIEAFVLWLIFKDFRM